MTAVVDDVLAGFGERESELPCMNCQTFRAVWVLVHPINVSRKWLWHIGGSEWPVFWALCCAVVGIYGSH